MKPINPIDVQSENEIKLRQQELQRTLLLAHESILANEFQTARSQFFIARSLSFYVGSELRVRVINEMADVVNWNLIDMIVKLFDEKLAA